MKIDTTGVTAPRPLREELADYAHRCWSKWTSHMLGVLGPVRHGRTSPKNEDKALAACDRWERQIDTDYADLSDAEKDSDRAVACQYASIVADWLEAELERLEVEHAEEDAADNAASSLGGYYLRTGRRQGYREAYATLAKALREIDQ